MKITFFPGSIMGYVGYPQALFTRALADGLAARGNDVRVVEERKNAILRRTLETEGAQPARQIYEDFPAIQVHTYEPRSGGRLLEWVTRELALIDIAVAVEGLPTELCRWLANVTRQGLIRVYITFDPAELTEERMAELEIDKFDAIIVAGETRVLPAKPVIPLSIARQDRDAGLIHHIPETQATQLVDAASVARKFEQVLRTLSTSAVISRPPQAIHQNGSQSPRGS